MRIRSAGSLKRAMLGAVLIVVLGSIPAQAGPMVKALDRSDNDFSFTYSPKGHIRAAWSSTVFRRNDKVSFFTYVRERGVDAPEGRPLTGVLDLRLATARPVHYDGRFAFVVRTVNGTKAIRRTTTRSFTLRPGDRRKVIRFRFNLDGGRYLALARFRTLDD
jgi:hypothetical protein